MDFIAFPLDSIKVFREFHLGFFCLELDCWRSLGYFTSTYRAINDYSNIMLQDDRSFLCFVLSCDTRDLIFWSVSKGSDSSMLTAWVVGTNYFRGMWQTASPIKLKMAILLHSVSLQTSLE